MSTFQGRNRLITVTLATFAHSEVLAPFFFMVGIQLRGEITHFKQILLPTIAALGGMLFPVLIFVALNRNSGIARGWPIVMPTDIALVMVVLLLMGKRASIELKTFMLAIAVADDLFSIAIIGIKYTASLRPGQIFSSIGCVALGALLWKVPFQNFLTRLVNLVVLPVYIFANLYPAFTDNFQVSSKVGNSIIVARIVGKAFGIVLLVWLANKLNIAKLSSGLKLGEVLAGAILAGMGLAVSFLIANLTYSDVILLNQVRAGLLCAALISGALGAATLLYFTRGRSNSGNA